MTDQEDAPSPKRPPFNDFHKLILFGAGALLLGTLVFMMTLNSVGEMMMRGRSGGGFMLVIGMTLALGFQIAGGTIIAKCVSKVVKPILED